MLSKLIDQGIVGITIRRAAAIGAVPKLAEHHRTKRDLVGCVLLKSGQQRRAALTQQRDPGIRVEHKLHGSGWRSSSVPCGGRSKSPCQAPAMLRTQSE